MHVTAKSAKSLESIASGLCSPTPSSGLDFEVQIGEKKFYCDSKNHGLLSNAATTSLAEDLVGIERASSEKGELSTNLLSIQQNDTTYIITKWLYRKVGCRWCPDENDDKKVN